MNDNAFSKQVKYIHNTNLNNFFPCMKFNPIVQLCYVYTYIHKLNSNPYTNNRLAENTTAIQQAVVNNSCSELCMVRV